jgi:hypothetical protein
MQASLQVMVEPEPCFVSKLHNCQGWCKNALCSGKSSSLGEDRSIVGSHIEMGEQMGALANRMIVDRALFLKGTE